MEEKISYQSAFCAALTGLIMKGQEREAAVNQAHALANWALERVNSSEDLETDTDRHLKAQAEEKMEKARQSGKGGMTGFQRPAGA